MAIRGIAFAAMTALAAGSVQAAGIGVRAGTTGVGADIGWSVMPTLSARLGYSALSYNTDVTVSSIRYDGKLKLSNFSGLLDFSPLGPFRITGGIVAHDNKIDVVGVPAAGSLTINGVTYSASQVGSLTGTVKPANRAAPYLGIGYGNVAGFGVNFYFDLGVMFQGSPEANLTAVCGSALSASQCTLLQNNVAAEARRLEDEYRKYRYLPVANIGVTIGF